MNRHIALCLGGVIAFGVSAVPLGVLTALPEPTHLAVTVPTRSRHLLRGSPVEAHPGIGVGPLAIRDRITSTLVPSRETTGIDLLTYRVEYGHRWLEEAVVPSIVGPFDQEGTYVCGLSVWLGAALFDTNAEARGVKAMLVRKLRRASPFKVSKETPIGTFRFTFSPVRDADIRFHLVTGSARLDVRIELEDGTYIEGDTRLAIESVSGTPALKRIGDAHTSFDGPSFTRLRREAIDFGATLGSNDSDGTGLFCLMTLGVGCVLSSLAADAAAEKIDKEGPATVNGELSKAIDDALAKVNQSLSALRRPLYPLPKRPRDGVRAKLAGDPTIAADGITLPLCVALTVADPKIDPAVPGPPQAVASLGAGLSRPNGRMIGMRADGRVLNHLLYFLWQSGTLRELGTSTALLDALPSDLQNLAFEVHGFDPGLPPVLIRTMEGTSGLPVALADIGMGTWDRRIVVGHAIGDVSVQTAGDKVTFAAALRHVFADCAEASGASAMSITPCLSDLLPAIRETIKGRSFSRSLSGGDILGRLPRMAFEGLRIDLSRLTASTDPQMMLLEVAADARIAEDEP